ncbi:MAG: hypothetical protein IKI57_07190 [Clostridia bacterium]|nr:hypothetical protein [Clostridia bacterium]
MPDIPKPCKQEVEKYLEQWKNNDKFVDLDKCLNHMFEKYPNNNDLNGILIKVTLLNTFYGTNIKDVYTVAKHILECNIDVSLNKGDEAIIDKIANVTFVDKNNKQKTMRLYSFATKYCSFHKPDFYPMYDSYLEKLLRYFRDEYKFDNFKTEDLKNYSKYKQILERFKKHYQINNYSVKEIDEYLWQLGKKEFA